ncbi:MAG: thioredoxin family protein [Saprospiraceae bacterium]|nr:thioredoxin family protein [Saprospiraceae bacterium]
MAFTESNMLPLGTKAPFFSLPDTVSDRILTLDDVASDVAMVIMFLCNHCPYVLHVNSGIVALAKDYQPKGVSFVGISSNDVDNYPQDAPDKMKIVAHTEGYTFPYLYDETQEVAKAYDAACTPDFYVFDGERRLVYRGRIDGSRPKNDLPVTGEDLRAVLDAVLRGDTVTEIQYPSGGCNIKWKPN